MQTCLRYEMRPKNIWTRVAFANRTSQMRSSDQPWKSMASANDCRGWCTCVQPAKCKKGVAPGRCVPPTCAHVSLHHPTHVQKCLHSLLEGMNVNRGMHIRLHIMHVNCNAKKGSWLRVGVIVDVINFKIEFNALVIWSILHFWRLGGIESPIGKLMEVWNLRHQVL